MSRQLTIMETINDLNTYIKALRYRDNDIYLKQDNLKFSYYTGTVRITDLSNAMKRGKNCIMISIQSKNFVHEEIEKIFPTFNYNIKKIFDTLSNLDISDMESIDYKGLRIFKALKQGVRVYSPFNHHIVKPLKSKPKKWTIPHILKVLINNQFDDFRCDGIYTDDYYNDAACNYQKGKINDVQSFIKDLMKEPSGWWTHESDGRLNIDCYHFHNTSMIVNI